MTSATATTDEDTLKERRRRLLAARTLAGLGQKELAAKLRKMGYSRGYSARTIGDMERGETPIQPQSIAVLAKGCGVTPAFFTVDFSTLEEPGSEATTDDRFERLQSELRVEQTERANLELALQAVLGEDLRRALAEARQQ